MKKQTIGRLFSLLMCATLAFTSVDLSVLAANSDSSDTEIVTEISDDTEETNESDTVIVSDEEIIVTTEDTEEDSTDNNEDSDDIVIVDDDDSENVFAEPSTGVTLSKYWEPTKSNAHLKTTGTVLNYIKNSDGNSSFTYGLDGKATATTSSSHYRDYFLHKEFTRLDSGAFSGNSTKLGSGNETCATKNKYLLRSFTTAAGSALETIGDYAFYECSNIKHVDLRSAINLKSIGTNAFTQCTYLEYILLPDNIVTLGAGVFEDDDNHRLYCKKGSTTEQTLLKAGYKYLYIDKASSAITVTTSDTMGGKPIVGNTERRQFTIKTSSTTEPQTEVAGGTITGTTTYYPQDKAGVEIKTSSDGFYIKNVYVNGSFEGTPTEYVVDHIIQDYDIKVTFAPRTYTVTFDANGGTSSLKSATVTYATKIGTIPTATRDGYRFLGWYTTVDGGSSINSETIYRTIGDSTYYAHWASDSEPTPTPDPSNPDEPTPTPEPSPSPIDPEIKTGYSVKYVMNGGNVSGKKALKLITNYENSSTTLPTPKKTGYKFIGWFIGNVKVKKISRNVSVCRGDLVVEARFAIIDGTNKLAKETDGPCNITYNKNGGTEKSMLPTSYKGQAKIKLPKVSKTGYTFLGWFANVNGELIKVSNVGYKCGICEGGKNISLTAMFTPNQYTIKFNKNGGKGKMASITTYYDVNTLLPPATFTKGSMVVDRWLDKKNNSGYPVNSYVKNLTTKGSITLKANWIIKNTKTNSIKSSLVSENDLNLD